MYFIYFSLMALNFKLIFNEKLSEIWLRLLLDLTQIKIKVCQIEDYCFLRNFNDINENNKTDNL